METLFRAIDSYCERTGPDLWSEPLNAVSNLAFILAGLWGLREVRRHRAGGFAELLCWWVIAIGVGSALFHTFANVLTVWMDVIPIATFTLALTLFNLRRFVGLSRRTSLLAFVAFYAVAGALTAMVPDWMRVASKGTSGYLPAFLALTFFGFVLVLRRHPAGWYDLAAASIFIVSATFRSVDATVCEALPIGTHFLWHVLNGLMLGVLLASVAWYGRPGSRAAGTGMTAPA
ncbi:ceramidase domain-containing protein [Aquibium sp. ELW1220]|uniref:ceramidase domain-containing protein n=1 Tax=Aquibium sp. ELW1220 TaxID=2976766 RepID=UPI0025B0B9E3|nr:ceramidase domain-containing protein [Aquibium sp. ELW1220]MDN2580003.1 ceramidase domain-containing protein [Aquibium sp. ELW1220]